MPPAKRILVVDDEAEHVQFLERVLHGQGHPALIALPIIMVTVLGNKDDRLRAVEAGANDFVSKPVDLVELHVRTNSLLKLKEARDEIRRRRDELESTVGDRTARLRGALHEVAEAQR